MLMVTFSFESRRLDLFFVVLEDVSPSVHIAELTEPPRWKMKYIYKSKEKEFQWL